MPVTEDTVIYDQNGTVIKAGKTTCWDCGNKNCKYRFDPYNTNGDCLAIK